MADTKAALQEALIEGATQGLTSKALFEYVKSEVPKAKTKKIVKAAFMALSEPKLKDRHILDTIYSLALQHRLDDSEPGDTSDEEEVTVPPPPPPKVAGKAASSRRRKSP